MIFLFCGVMLYYIFPKKAQWFILLCLSIVFYCLAAKPYTILFIIASTLLAYIASILLVIPKYQKSRKLITAVTIFAILCNITIWFLLKGYGFWVLGGSMIHAVIPSFPQLHALPIIASLGMGYYTAQVIGYILDCYWEICTPQKNILKLFLFVIFFPQLIVGPISQYTQLEHLYEEHHFSYKNLTFGTQRILWGLFKKLVISDRIAVIVNAIWADTLTFNGIWIWIAVLLYPLQIYTDFSGCVDIILGSGELFDIHMPENFRNPFFSKNCQEFWQRWHITLGVWAKDHVYYPILKSKPILCLRKWSKKHFNKRTARLIPWTAGMGGLWFIMGFWHGSSRHIVGVSAYFWTILVMGEIFSPFIEKVTNMLKVDTNCFSWRLFQSVRTYVLYAIGAVMFTAPSLRKAFSHIGILIYSFRPSKWNPWILNDRSILNTGTTYKDLNLIIIGLAAVLLVDILNEKYGYARIWLANQILVFRWFVYFLLFFTVIIFGVYGPAFDASSFIYGQF